MLRCTAHFRPSHSIVRSENLESPKSLEVVNQLVYDGVVGVRTVFQKSVDTPEKRCRMLGSHFGDGTSESEADVWQKEASERLVMDGSCQARAVTYKWKERGTRVFEEIGGHLPQADLDDHLSMPTNECGPFCHRRSALMRFHH
ncbi:hypothetical protein CERZMDRAFT_82197 [Cercospora zeae-maydis SCOH1-5]|uniref:Uncharacterized protein n=1 Tax=Cercospora zeae-maydis SCOH1-5 TaxID=717836 RepID=A0A6A6FP94_9PEZI|nr:hypothetical protein CERZMDRAFT_82197 [Cercospora zeae-maydis SCOH1-5]